MIDLYTNTQFLDFLYDVTSDRTLYEESIKWFHEPSITVTDSSDWSQNIPLVPLHEIDTHSSINLQYDSDNFIEDPDMDWVTASQDYIEYKELSEFYDGTVITPMSLSLDPFEIQPISYFTTQSEFEYHRGEIAAHMFDSSTYPSSSRTIQDVSEKYGLIGITHTVILEPEGSDKKFILLGRNSEKRSTYPTLYSTVPAGLLEPYHIGETMNETTYNHFVEELSEEALHGRTTAEELDELFDESNIDVSITATSINPVNYNLEVAAVERITGQIADYILESLRPNEEFSSINAYPYTAFESVDTLPLLKESFSPLSEYSLYSVLAKEFDNWELEFTQ